MQNSNLVEVAVGLANVDPLPGKPRISDLADATLDVEELAHVPCPAQGGEKDVRIPTSFAEMRTKE